MDHLGIHVCDHLQCSGNTPGLHRDAPGCLKDTPDGFEDTRGWDLRAIIVLADVSLSIRELYDNIAGVLLEASDHWIPGSQWL